MSWKMTHRESTSNKAVANLLVEDLNTYVRSAGQMQVAKLAISDQAGGDARGVLYYWGDDDPPRVTDQARKWAVATFVDRTSYDEAYADALGFLDGTKAIGGIKLTLQQQAAAQVGMANRKDGDFHLSVFYPVEFASSGP